MKKRIFVFAVAVWVTLSLCASAWGAAYSIESVTREYEKLYDVDNRQGEDLSVRIRTKVSGFSDSSAYGSSNAKILQVKVTGHEGKVTDFKLTSNSGTNNETNSVRFTLEQSEGMRNYDVKMTGKIAASCDLTVTVSLLTEDFATATPGSSVGQDSVSRTFTITLSDEDGIDERNDAFGLEPYAVPASDSELEGTAADPASSNTSWDGRDPVFGTGTQGDSKNKPKIATYSLKFYGSTSTTLKSGTADEFKIEIDGPTPLVDVYISYKHAKKLWPASKDYFTSEANNIRLNRANIEAFKLPFRVISYDLNNASGQNKLTKHYITIAYNGAKVSYKGFPLTISASNLGTVSSKGVNKPVTKTYKIDIVSTRSTPQWVTSDGVLGEKLTNPDTGKLSKNADTIPVRLDYSGREVFTTSYTVSCDPPYSLEAKGAKDGVTATVYQPVLNRFGEVETPGYVVIGGSFDKAKVEDKDGNSKEAKVTVTLKAAGSVKNTSFKSTVMGKVSPYYPANKIISKDNAYYLAGIKRVQAKKVPSVKFAAKGSKTITYSLVDGAQELAAHGLSFDAKKGAVIALGDKKNITATISGDAFQSIDIAVTANNGTGKKATVRAEIGITGEKPKFATKTLTISRDVLKGLSDDTVLTAYPIKLQNASGDHLVYTFADSNSSSDLRAIGLGLDSSGCLKILSSKDIKATKGTKISVNADNLGASAAGSITVVVADPVPVISADSTASFTSASKDAEVTVTLSLKENTTDGAKIKWTLATKPTASDVSSTLKAATDGKTATLTLKLKKNVTAGQTYTAGIVAQNPHTKLESSEFTINITVGSIAAAQLASAQARVAVIGGAYGSSPEAEAEPESESEEAVLTFGAPRTEASLTAGQNAFIQRNGYTVIAVLPEVSASAEGQADIPVELYENAPVGAKLVWLPFPKNVEETEDDRIADFYDEDGAAIENVPDGRNITVSAWMRTGVTYQPVIAAEQ